MFVHKIEEAKDAHRQRIRDEIAIRLYVEYFKQQAGLMHTEVSDELLRNIADQALERADRFQDVYYE